MRLRFPLAALACLISACSDAPAPEPFAEIKAGLEAGTYGLVNEILVLQDGRPILRWKTQHDYVSITEHLKDAPRPYRFSRGQYDYADPDWHPYYQDTRLHSLQSVTKTIVSLSIGALENQGLIPPVEEAKLLDYLSGDYDLPKDDTLWAAVTLADLLSMRMGLDWNEGGPETDEGSITYLEWQVSDWVRHTLARPMAHTAGTVYDYNGAATHLLSAVVQHASGQSLADFTEANIFEPMDIQSSYWKQTPAGLNDGQGGLYLQAEDLAKFCKLAEQQGAWGGNQIVSKDYLDRSLRLTSQFKKDDPNAPYYKGYGYTWWIDRETQAGPSYSMNGYGGQRLYCMPEADIAIVMLAWNVPDLERPDLVRVYKDAGEALHQRIIDAVLGG